MHRRDPRRVRGTESTTTTTTTTTTNPVHCEHSCENLKARTQPYPPRPSVTMQCMNACMPVAVVQTLHVCLSDARYQPSCRACSSGLSSGDYSECVANLLVLGSTIGCFDDTPVDACDFVDCHDHGSCVESSGIAECDCSELYSGLTCTQCAVPGTTYVLSTVTTDQMCPAFHVLAAARTKLMQRWRGGARRNERCLTG